MIQFADGSTINHCFCYMDGSSCDHPKCTKGLKAMAILYKPSPFASINPDPSMTEQEHKDSCDINKMVKNVLRGMQVRGGKNPRYGVDDLTVDPVSHRIQKEQIEAELLETFANNEFSEEEIQAIDKINPQLKSKFKLKKKNSTNTQPPKNDDDKTTTTPSAAPQNPNPSSKPSST